MSTLVDNILIDLGEISYNILIFNSDIGLFKMTQTFSELLILVPTVLTTGFVLFVATVVQGIMNEQDAITFKNFLTEFIRHALKSPYVIVVSSITFIGMVPYWFFFGFSNRWFSAGIILWILTSVVSKYTAIPIYVHITGLRITGFKNIPIISDGDINKLLQERRKLQIANILRSILSLASVVAMVIGFY